MRVSLTILIAAQLFSTSAKAAEPALGNPVFPGWYADPEGIVFGDRYWIYPTYSAPYDSQVFFDAFSSPDLEHWTKHERILDIKDVKWLRRALWAPSIIAKDARYFLFFSANDIQNNEEQGGIGVAVAGKPEGPFKDYLGKPLIDRFHHGAQPIDPFVFRDVDGTHYLFYGGWRHCNVARLRDDFRGFEPFPDGQTFKEVTPEHYVEGPFMFVRNGKYYFMWSEGGWTGPDYSVAYAIADGPTGPFKRIGKILQQDPAVATGAGHHSVIQVPGKDIWHIVYHRRPLGEQNGNHRVTCIDRMEFDENGLIRPVRITTAGVSPHPISGAKATVSPSTRVLTEHSREDMRFKLGAIPPPATDDLAATARLRLVSGRMDPNSGVLEVLADGKVPGGQDEPRSNFFFANSREPSRLTIDLGKPVALSGVATYSWHSDSRAGQRYRLYGADGTAASFVAAPGAGVNPAEAGWTLLARVDTSEKGGGQHAVAVVGENDKPLGTYRHLLLDAVPNQDSRGFGNTFFSEIDVIAANGQAPIRTGSVEKPVFEREGVRITLDPTASPDLLPWFRDKAIPAMLEWYPKIARMIVVPGKTPPAPKAFQIELREGQILPGHDGIPGYALGDRIVVSSKFMREQLQGEALGCLIHEMVHIVQFGAGKRAHRSVPSWFFEGATDYIRWFHFEPEKNGAVTHLPDRVRYHDSYRVTANFMDWVTRNHTKDLLAKVHIAIHEGYSDELWEKWTGKPVAELEAQWKAELNAALKSRR